MLKAPEFSAVVLVAGHGHRAARATGATYCRRKNLQKIAGVPVFLHSLRIFFSFKNLSTLVLVLPASDEPLYRRALAECPFPFAKKLDKSLLLSHGGKERYDSVRAGLAKLPRPASKNAFVAIHDGARPLLSKKLVAQLLRHAFLPRLRKIHAGVLPSKKLVDALKIVNAAGFIEKSLPRENMMAVATPQVFPLSFLLRAYEKYQKLAESPFKNTAGGAPLDTAGVVPLDDAGVYLAAGYPVFCYETREPNFKITYAEDFGLIEKLIKK